MTLLPLIDRELRARARRPATYWVRCLGALCVLVIWLVLVFGGGGQAYGELGKRVFIAMGVLGFGFCLLAGIFLTADCLSEEKREGTLGLLFLTDLKGYDVVLGKLAATSVHAVCGLMAILPVLGLSLLMGGVTVGEFWRVALVLVVTLFLSLAMGMFVSSVAHDAREAMTGTFLGMVVLGGVFPALWWLQTAMFRTGTSSLVLFPSPAYAYRAAFDFCYGTMNGPRDFWTSVHTVFWLGVGLLVVAAIILPRAWEERRQSGPLTGWWSRQRKRALKVLKWQAWCDPSWWARVKLAGASRLVVRKVPRRELLERSPLSWLASRDASPMTMGRTLVGLLGALWLTSFLIAVVKGSGSPPVALLICFFTAYALHQVVKYLLAVEATRQLSEDRQSGALELLLVTPVREADILQGQSWALDQRFRWIQRVPVMVNASLIALVLFNANDMFNGAQQTIFLELFAGGLVLFALDFSALKTVGMWSALRAQRHQRAALATLGWVQLAPWLAIFLMVFLMMQTHLSAFAFEMLFACWFAVGMINDLVVLARAKEALGRGFRACLEGAQRREENRAARAASYRSLLTDPRPSVMDSAR